MNLDEHLAGENIFHLRQGIELIRKLDDKLFTGGAVGPFRGGVGSQFRHCIDFYQCFLSGLNDGRIDYCRRARDARLETDREHAASASDRLVAELRRLDLATAHRIVEVRSDLPRPGAEELAWSQSTVLRELQFLSSHTIHHYALIVALLMMKDFDLGPALENFGVAPSTLGHWQESRKLARVE